jgi:MYXO-CTERM domain-containing protein
VQSLTWEVTDPASGFNGFFLDNILVDIDTNGQAPEPGGITLLLAGLVALYRRRRA